MAIFKHIHKAARFPNRAGCTSKRDVHRLMEYLLRTTAEGKIVWSNFGNDTPEGVTDEVMALSRPDLRYKAYHFMMSFPLAERATWEKNLDAVFGDFGDRFKVHRMIWASHEDKDNFHVHGLVFAQNAAGKKLRLETRDGARAVPVALSLRKMAEDWEDKLGTRKTGRSRASEFSISKDALEMACREHREGKAKSPVPAKIQLRAEIQRLVSVSTSFADLQSRAVVAGIEVRFTAYDNGTGVSFSNGDVSLRGREAGFTFETLTQIFHEPNPTIVRSQPDRSMAAGNRSSRCRPTSTRVRKTNRHPKSNIRDATFKQRSQPNPYRCIEETLRIIGHLNHAGGMLNFLQFLTRFLEQIGTHDTRSRPRQQPRPSL